MSTEDRPLTGSDFVDLFCRYFDVPENMRMVSLSIGTVSQNGNEPVVATVVFETDIPVELGAYLLGKRSYTLVPKNSSEVV